MRPSLADADRVGVFAAWSAGPRWWTLMFFPFAVLEWFNLLSIRPLMIRWWFKHNPKFSETYHRTLDRTGILFRTHSIDSRITWEHYTKVLEDDGCGFSCTARGCTR
jgi:hypothetical protein